MKALQKLTNILVIILIIFSVGTNAQWAKLQEMIVSDIMNPGTTVVGTDIYVMGGQWSGANLNIQKFDTNTFKWTYNYSPIPNEANSIARYGNQYIYFFPMSGCEVHRYDIYQDNWEYNITTPPLCFSDRLIKPITIMRNFEEEIYLFHYDTEKAASVKYNPSTDIWTPISSVPSELTFLWGFDVTTDDQQQYIYLAGGRSNNWPYGETARTFYYDIDYDTWNEISNMLTPHAYGHSLEQKDGFLYVIGGSLNEDALCSIERLDISGILSGINTPPTWELYDTIPVYYCEYVFSGSLVGDYFYQYAGVRIQDSSVAMYSITGIPLPEDIPPQCTPSSQNTFPKSAITVALGENPETHYLEAIVPFDTNCIPIAPIKQLPNGMENCGNGDYNVKWYKIAAQTDSYKLSVSSCNSNFDTILFVYTAVDNTDQCYDQWGNFFPGPGCNWPPSVDLSDLTYQSCNDDYTVYPDGCNEFTSGIEVPRINSGSFIYIGVSAFNHGAVTEGSGSLNITLSPITPAVDESILEYLQTVQTPILTTLQTDLDLIIPEVDNISSSLTSFTQSFDSFACSVTLQNEIFTQSFTSLSTQLQSTTDTVTDVFDYVVAIDNSVSDILQNSISLITAGNSILADTSSLISSVSDISSSQLTIISAVQSILTQTGTLHDQIDQLSIDLNNQEVALDQSISTLGSSLTDDISNFHNDFTSTISSLNTDILSNLDSMNSSLTSILNSLSSSITSSVSSLQNNVTSTINSSFSNLNSQLSSVAADITNFMSTNLTSTITTSANEIKTLITNYEYENALIEGNLYVSSRFKSPAEMGGYLENLNNYVVDAYNSLKAKAQQISLVSTSSACQNSALCTFYYKANPLYQTSYSSYVSNYNSKKYAAAFKALVSAYNTLFYK